MEQQRGALGVYLGYADGVGKTAAMLDAAGRRHAAGSDVVIASVETQDRSITEQRLEAFEVLPPRTTEHRGAELHEMDLDAVLARTPEVAVVEDLAHLNAPGSRHTHRFQDVEELLAAGIDVYTTLNIYQLDSLTDVVAQITGISVEATVPDRLLENADTVELVDASPDEVVRRFDAGEISSILEDAASFYRVGNLTALRELALRRVAEYVDEDMRRYMEDKNIAGPWPASDRLLVCISPSPLSERLVRTGRRLATDINAEWFAVYVETPAHATLSEAERDRVTRTLHLAEALGAKTMTLSGDSVAEVVSAYARQHNVTKIVAGKPLRSRWVELLRGSVVDQIVRERGDFDVYVISSTETDSPRLSEPTVHAHEGTWYRFAESLALVGAASVLGLFIRPFIAPTNLVMLYLLVVVIAALRHGRGPSIAAAVLSVVAFDLLFVPPWYTFAVADAEYLLTFGGLLIVGLVISTLAARAREQADAAQQRERQTTSSYELSRDLAAAVELGEIADVVTTHVEQTFGGDAAVLLPTEGQLTVCGHTTDFSFDTDDEQSAAAWAFEHKQAAGSGTQTLADARGQYLPLTTAHAARTVGLLAVQWDSKNRIPLPPEQRRLLETFARQAALAIERVQLAEKASQAQLLRAKEQLQTALLDSISHDLRTPLASITGVLSSLRDGDAYLDAGARQELIETAWEESERLNRLVGNLLDMTRLESGALKITREPCDLQDVIGVALTRLENRLQNRPVDVDVNDSLPLISADFVLIVQALVNVIDNAIKYSPAGSPITIGVRPCIDEEAIEIAVADRGVGLPDGDPSRVFDKFYRGRRSNGAGGTGLGLSISRGIIEAHGGRMWAERRPDGGTVIRFSLPRIEESVSAQGENT